MNKLEAKLAQIMGVEKLSGLDKFSLLCGSIGLIVDTIAIIGFSGGLVLPYLPVPNKTPNGGLLLTAFLGFYSLTLIIWFLIRFERAKREKRGLVNDLSFRALDSITEDSSWGLILIPGLGTIYMLFVEETTIVISFLSVFISWLPATLWIYTLSTNPWLGIGIGLAASLVLSQYATWFALILDKFFY